MLAQQVCSLAEFELV